MRSVASRRLRIPVMVVAIVVLLSQAAYGARTVDRPEGGPWKQLKRLIVRVLDQMSVPPG